uniref:Uncharacterized protein n=1 Tax=Solanum lycopersicum TaxID=4081 RepID=A0A3Q7EG53_SOLLC
MLYFRMPPKKRKRLKMSSLITMKKIQLRICQRTMVKTPRSRLSYVHPFPKRFSSSSMKYRWACARLRSVLLFSFMMRSSL